MNKKIAVTKTELKKLKATREDKKAFWQAQEMKNLPVMKNLGIKTYEQYCEVEKTCQGLLWFLQSAIEKKGVSDVKNLVDGLFSDDQVELMTGWMYCESATSNLLSWVKTYQGDSKGKNFGAIMGTVCRPVKKKRVDVSEKRSLDPDL